MGSIFQIDSNRLSHQQVHTLHAGALQVGHRGWSTCPAAQSPLIWAGVHHGQQPHLWEQGEGWPMKKLRKHTFIQNTDLGLTEVQGPMLSRQIHLRVVRGPGEFPHWVAQITGKTAQHVWKLLTNNAPRNQKPEILGNIVLAISLYLTAFPYISISGKSAGPRPDCWSKLWSGCPGKNDTLWPHLRQGTMKLKPRSLSREGTQSTCSTGGNLEVRNAPIE